MSDADEYVYVAFAGCGCKVAVCSEAMPAKDRAKHVGKWIRDGHTVQRETVAIFRTTPFGHKCDKAQVKPARQETLTV